ncbi:hypothetical protein Pisl_1461 [Pyrobaculum islandicum DSM 4184]|uniref:Uncharacterized protein n=1 Tax=Pyrobaculum islandicum (strain DSM 4184 / JCM 9189 / GEO3) TaxID=384616 RepID=A1RUI5_PYRIL|nr:hypothetical protein Pisl_1461 [Pyrobaculum islandicum DSM 4184]
MLGLQRRLWVVWLGRRASRGESRRAVAAGAAGNPRAAVWVNVMMAAAVLAFSNIVARAVKMFNVERYVLAMLLTFAATRTTVVVSNVLILAGVIHTPLLSPQVQFTLAIHIATLAVITPVFQPAHVSNAVSRQPLCHFLLPRLTCLTATTSGR